MKKEKLKCSVCVNTNNEPVINIQGAYNKCASCIREDHENDRQKINRLERILEYIINCGI